MGILSDNLFDEITNNHLVERKFIATYHGKPRTISADPELCNIVVNNQIVTYADSQKIWIKYIDDGEHYGFQGVMMYFPPGFDEKFDKVECDDLGGKIFLSIENRTSRFGNPQWNDLLPVTDVSELDAAIEYVNKTIQMYCDNCENYLKYKHYVENYLKYKKTYVEAYQILQNYSNF